MPRATQRRSGGSVPIPIEAVSTAATSDTRAAQQTTKVPQDMFETILNGLGEMVQKETSNPRRRESIRLCRDFVSEYGFPKEDHCIWVKDGVVKVLTEEECMRLPGSPNNVDHFLLVSSVYLT
jgi:hypothetical protein